MVLVLAIFMISCTPGQEEQLMSPAVQQDIMESEEPEFEVEEVEIIGPEIEEVEVVEIESVEDLEYDEAVADLMAKSEDTDNYKYFFQSSIRNKYGSYESGPSYEVYIKGEKVKKIYPREIKLKEDVYYNEVYLDLDKEEAVGICTESGMNCKPIWDKAFELDYPTEKLLMTPWKLIQNIDPETEEVGSEVFDNRNLLILEYDNAKGEKEKLSVDKYSGLPLKRVVYTYEDDEKIILESYTFTMLAVGGVKNVDITLPEKYELS